MINSLLLRMSRFYSRTPIGDIYPLDSRIMDILPFFRDLEDVRSRAFYIEIREKNASGALKTIPGIETILGPKFGTNGSIKIIDADGTSYDGMVTFITRRMRVHLPNFMDPSNFMGNQLMLNSTLVYLNQFVSLMAKRILEAIPTITRFRITIFAPRIRGSSLDCPDYGDPQEFFLRTVDIEGILEDVPNNLIEDMVYDS